MKYEALSNHLLIREMLKNMATVIHETPKFSHVRRVLAMYISFWLVWN